MASLEFNGSRALFTPPGGLPVNDAGTFHFPPPAPGRTSL